MPTLVKDDTSRANPIPFGVPMLVPDRELFAVGMSQPVRIRMSGSRTNTPPIEGGLISRHSVISFDDDRQVSAARTWHESGRWLRSRYVTVAGDTRQDELILPVARRLGELALLEEDWNSYGGHKPTATALKAAIGFYKRFAEEYGGIFGEYTLPTSISPLPSGGIELEWRGNNRLTAIDVGPDGKWGYLQKVRRGRSARSKEENDVPEAALTPLILEELVARLYG